MHPSSSCVSCCVLQHDAVLGNYMHELPSPLWFTCGTWWLMCTIQHASCYCGYWGKDALAARSFPKESSAAGDYLPVVRRSHSASIVVMRRCYGGRAGSRGGRGSRGQPRGIQARDSQHPHRAAGLAGGAGRSEVRRSPSPCAAPLHEWWLALYAQGSSYGRLSIVSSQAFCGWPASQHDEVQDGEVALKRARCVLVHIGCSMRSIM